ncbi:ExbD/TolR family protein [Desertivirga xinjiangensis]|uniref:ExbD/TolR family protein n=1 Tax=Desertivirga xinjiangensis TaxID=539206 RepID=UPI00210CE2FD|nr:biopolymer transporter ExbD [Pedobacter xinjiangensis]
MAELKSSGGSLRGRNQSRNVSLSPRVDMTPMVDLMFLLITFFMLTTTLSKPVAMPLAMPVNPESEPNTRVPEDRTMTIYIGKENKLHWLVGNSAKPLESSSNDGFQRNTIRNTLRAKNIEAIKRTGDSSKGLIVIIKPSDKSNYKNLVDLLDELNISQIKSYYIVDLVPGDTEIMKKARVY